jgi:hypothetical protein
MYMAKAGRSPAHRCKHREAADVHRGRQVPQGQGRMKRGGRLTALWRQSDARFLLTRGRRFPTPSSIDGHEESFAAVAVLSLSRRPNEAFGRHYLPHAINCIVGGRAFFEKLADL